MSRNIDMYFPEEVVEMHLMEEVSLLTSWRRYRSINRSDMAARLSITVDRLDSLEENGSKVERDVLKDIANILNVSVEQLIE